MIKKTSQLAYFCDPDGYQVSVKRLLGRKMAGNSFLRAVIDHTDPETEFLYGLTPAKDAFNTFDAFVNEAKPGLETRWCPPQRTDLLSETKILYTPDPNLQDFANLRLKAPLDSYSICGVTHTTASHSVMEKIQSLYRSPIMPWDALVCTSQSVLTTVNTILEKEHEVLTWRLGKHAKPKVCQMPVIPLGIHTKNFSRNKKQYLQARSVLNIAKDETVFLYVGRLNPYSKAHPYSMYAGLQEVAKRTGKKITLIECGWYEQDVVKDDMDACKRVACPDVRCIDVDGRNFRDRDGCWAAGDVFVSLSDNVQETFGLTPVEAMAVGMPVLLSDWDGYKELMTDGVEGFKVPTTMLDETDEFSQSYAAGAVYGRYCASVSMVTGVDIAVFADRAQKLVESKDLRRKMGAEGQRRAKSVFDWSVVYGSYRELWSELDNIRLSARQMSESKSMLETAPPVAASRMSPSDLFPSYPSVFLSKDVCVKAIPGKTVADFSRLASLKLFTRSKVSLPTTEGVEALLQFLSTVESASIAALSKNFKAPLSSVKRTVAILIKFGLVTLAEWPIDTGAALHK
ncbi:MAG: glycosyltransferase family 4 protein [Kordiimonadaceae bacterium]|nr:glycosyltransferase family 4 protein [Kordiimonadaceae bacterium]